MHWFFRNFLVFAFFKSLPDGFGSWERAHFVVKIFLNKYSQSSCVQMQQFAAVQQTSTLKLAKFFFKFQTKESTLRVNKSEITVENTFKFDYFEIKGSHGTNKDGKILFGFFCWFVTSPLTFKTPNRYIIVFQELFGFSIFKVAP